MKSRLSTLFAVLGAAAAVALTLAAPAFASGVTGGFSAGSGYCWEPDSSTGVGAHEILATSPIISPAQTSGIVGGGQRVGFFATLQRWNGTSWVASQFSPLYTKTAAWGFDDGRWFDTYRGTWANGLTRFRVSVGSGAYRLRYDYFWFDSNDYVSGQTSSLSWGHRDDRRASVTTTGWAYVDWCVY